MTDHLRRLSELVERLRATKPHCNFGSDLAAIHARTAADAIENLIGDVETTQLCFDINWKALCESGQREKTLLARITALEAALEPFAEECIRQERVTSFADGDCIIPRSRITIGDLRRAQSALHSGSETRDE